MLQPVFLVNTLSARFIVLECLFSGGWGPLPIPGFRFPRERILIDLFVGMLLGLARHNGPQRGELVRCVLTAPGQQGSQYARIKTCHEERSHQANIKQYYVSVIMIFFNYREEKTDWILIFLRNTLYCIILD